MVVVIPTDRPKSVRNRCLIDVFDRVEFSVGVGIFVMRLSQISFFFSWKLWTN